MHSLFCLSSDGGNEVECIECPLVVEAKGKLYILYPGPTSSVLVSGHDAERYRELFVLCKDIQERLGREGKVPEELVEKVLRMLGADNKA